MQNKVELIPSYLKNKIKQHREEKYIRKITTYKPITEKTNKMKLQTQE